MLEFDKEKIELNKKYEFKGKEYTNCIIKNNCTTCESNNRSIIKTNYEIALRKYMKKEFGENYIW